MTAVSARSARRGLGAAGSALAGEVRRLARRPPRALRARGWRAGTLTLAVVAAVGTLAAAQAAGIGDHALELCCAESAALPAPLALLRLLGSLAAPTPHLPVWGALLQVLAVVGLAETTVGPRRTAGVGFAGHAAGTLSARVMLWVGSRSWIGLAPAVAAALDTGPSAAVVALVAYLGCVRRTPLLLSLVVAAMVGEELAAPSLAGREHLIAMATGALCAGPRLALQARRRMRAGGGSLTDAVKPLHTDDPTASVGCGPTRTGEASMTVGKAAALRRAGCLAAMLAAEVAAVAGLHRLGGLAAFRIPWQHLGRDLGPWLLHTPVEDVLGAVLRLVALLVAWWLFGSTALYLLASLTRVPALVRGVEWLALPWVRRVADRAVAVALATSIAGAGATPAVAGTALVRRAPGPLAAPATTSAPTTTGYLPHPAGTGAPRGAAPSGTTTTAPATTVPATATTVPATTTTRPPATTGRPPATTGQRPATTPSAAPPGPKPTFRATTSSAPPTTTRPVVPPPTRAAGPPPTAAPGGRGAAPATTAPGGGYLPHPAGTTTTTTRPPSGSGSAPTPAPTPAPGTGARATTYQVQPGDSLWLIAKRHLAHVSGRSPRTLRNREIAAYWLRVLAANRGHLRSGRADLIYPGEYVRLPAVRGVDAAGS